MNTTNQIKWPDLTPARIHDTSHRL